MCMYINMNVQAHMTQSLSILLKHQRRLLYCRLEEELSDVGGCGQSQRSVPTGHQWIVDWSSHWSLSCSEISEISSHEMSDFTVNDANQCLLYIMICLKFGDEM